MHTSVPKISSPWVTCHGSHRPSSPPQSPQFSFEKSTILNPTKYSTIIHVPSPLPLKTVPGPYPGLHILLWRITNIITQHILRDNRHAFAFAFWVPPGHKIDIIPHAIPSLTPPKPYNFAGFVLVNYMNLGSDIL